MFRCFLCGHEVIWGADFMGSEMGYVDENAPEEEDFVVGTYHCPHCLAEYAVKSVSEKDYDKYPFNRERMESVKES